VCLLEVKNNCLLCSRCFGQIGQQLLQVRDENLDVAFIHTGPFLLSDSPTVRGAIKIVQPIVSINDLDQAYVQRAFDRQ
jgi:hypothetical protein